MNTSNLGSQKIAIIGAGPCGITTAKNLIELGLNNITVFEKNDQLGGNWVYSEQNQHTSIYETTHLISSKRLSEFEDFPMPADYPDYPSHSQILKYFNDYAKHFGVISYVQFNTIVTKIERNAQNNWDIMYQSEEREYQNTFDYLFIANGHHWDPITPDYPGNFDGEILHSHQYKKAEPFRNKKVLVVGGGNSACDVAVEIARVAQKTGISIRRGHHIFPKFIFGKPTDIAFAKVHWMPVWLKQKLANFVIRLLQGRYSKYKLQKPQSKPLEEHPTINSELLYFIRHGKVHPYVGINKFEGHQVHFNNGQWDRFDTVIFATGYKISFPFFDTEFIDYRELNHIPLYKKMMHPNYENLYFIGLFQPQGCIWPLADYQAKIAANIIAGRLKRPSHLMQKIESDIEQSRRYFKKNRRHALEVDYQTFRKTLLEELDFL